MNQDRITAAARADGLQAILPLVEATIDGAYSAVCAGGSLGVTAEEVRDIVGCTLNSARSRLTELKLEGRVFAVGRRMNRAGTVRISIWMPKKGEAA